MVAKEHPHQQLLANKLKQRWSETGSGPDVQKKLDAIKETLNVRERLKRLEKSRRDDVSKSHSDQTNALKYLEKVKKDAKLDETDSSSLDMRKALPKEALEVARKDEDEIVSREDIEAENASNQLVDVFQKRKRVTPDARLKELKSEHPAHAMREKANELMRANDLKMAVAMYDEALSQCEADLRRKRREEEEEEMSDSNQNDKNNDTELSEEELIAVVTLCNRSKAKLRDGEDLLGALEDAISATTIAPDWSKARFRCGEAYAALSAWSLAVASLRVGEKLVECEKGSSVQPFKDLLDVIAIRAAKYGSPAGFDGRVIYVRSAGEEAWLGKEAPTNAEFDVTDEHKNPINTERYSKEDGHMAEARRKAEVNKNTALHARSIRDAVEMASDGDKILLLRGTHNGCGETVCVTKRVWIKG